MDYYCIVWSETREEIKKLFICFFGFWFHVEKKEKNCLKCRSILVEQMEWEKNEEICINEQK